MFAGADFVFTEMVRGDKILDGDEHQLKKLFIPKDMEDVTIVQIICEDIELIDKTVTEVMKKNPNVFEINYNMGCPQSTLAKNECGGGIVGNSILVGKVAKKLFDACSKFNVKPSIKIRLGIKRDDITIYENTKQIQSAGIKKIYIHGRVLKDSYNKPATYEEIEKVVNDFPRMEIIANGDVVDSLSLSKILKTNAKGVLVGRAALENPFVFKELKSIGGYELKKSGVSILDKREVLLKFLEFAKLDDVSLSHIKQNIAYMSKGIIGGADLRRKINDLENIDEIIKIIEKFN